MVDLIVDRLVLCLQLRTVSAERLSPDFASLAGAAQRDDVERAVRLWLDLGAGATGA